MKDMEKVKELLSNPARWTKGHWARNKDGGICSYDNPEATCWCLLGACKAVGVPYDYIRRVINPVYKSIHEFNDKITTTHEDIMAVLDKAIALEKGGV